MIREESDPNASSSRIRNPRVHQTSQSIHGRLTTPSRAVHPNRASSRESQGRPQAHAPTSWRIRVQSTSGIECETATTDRRIRRQHGSSSDAHRSCCAGERTDSGAGNAQRRARRDLHGSKAASNRHSAASDRRPRPRASLGSLGSSAHTKHPRPNHARRITGSACGRRDGGPHRSPVRRKSRVHSRADDRLA
jgi:hypothetical protein